MNPQTGLTPQNVIDNLKELKSLTGDASGAQRLAWTATWQKARDWLAKKLSALPVTVEIDEAGNTWATLAGRSGHSLVLGSHIDSVANGGWLDGCLGVMGALEVLRTLAAQGAPPVTVCLVSWADEEGSRFGRSLLGSSAVTGFFDPEELRGFTDKEGVRLADALADYGVDIDRARQSARELEYAAAYLELHIEQGPVLESLGLPLGVVLGTLGVERHAIRYSGQTAHAGSTPMDMRRDALAPAARLELEIRQIARRHAGVCTMGSVVTRPGIVTAVAGQCDVLLDQRCMDPVQLAGMLQDAREASARFCAEEKVTEEWKRLIQIEPIHFHPELIDLCEAAVRETCGQSQCLPSGPLHDAAYVARRGVPTAMLFVQSLNGLSHTVEEDTREEHLLLAVQAFYNLANKTINWIMAK